MFVTIRVMGLRTYKNPIGDIITFKLCLKTVKQYNRSVFDQSGNFLRFKFSALNFVRTFYAFTPKSQYPMPM